MQPLIGPPIPIHVLATTSGPMQAVALALVVASLAVHVYFLVWCFLFLRRWGRETDERWRQLDEQERQIEEQERKWREGRRDFDDPVLQLRAASERLQGCLSERVQLLCVLLRRSTACPTRGPHSRKEMTVLLDVSTAAFVVLLHHTIRTIADELETFFGRPDSRAAVERGPHDDATETRPR